MSNGRRQECEGVKKCGKLGVGGCPKKKVGGSRESGGKMEFPMPFCASLSHGGWRWSEFEKISSDLLFLPSLLNVFFLSANATVGWNFREISFCFFLLPCLFVEVSGEQHSSE